MHWCSTKNKNRKIGVCGKSDCENCVKNSCESHEMMKKFWDAKNKLQPYEVPKNSTQFIDFICENGHPFSVRPNHVSTGKHWCKTCAKGGESFKNHPLAEYFSPNNTASIEKLSTGSHEKIKIQCPTCKVDHEKETRYFVKNPNNLCSCFPKIDHQVEDQTEMIIQRIKKCWSKSNELTFEQVSSGSQVKIKFDCDKCNHTFAPEYKSVMNGSWCPYCANQKLCDDNDCKVCFEKSFASHPRAKFWSENNKVPPRMVFKNSNIVYLLKCVECDHEFDMRPNTINQKDRWCNICSGRELCLDNNCKLCFEHSFASYEHKDTWSEKNTVSPREVFKCVAKAFWFDCHKCKLPYEQRLDNKVCGKNACPNCVHKTEAKLYDWLLKNFPDVKREVKFPWLKMEGKKQSCRFDFYIKSLKLVIELDGIQHYEQVSNWSSPEEIKKRDLFKIEQSKLKKISTLRLFQADVFNDSHDWQGFLKLYCKKYETPCVISFKSGEITQQ